MLFKESAQALNVALLEHLRSPDRAQLQEDLRKRRNLIGRRGLTSSRQRYAALPGAHQKGRCRLDLHRPESGGALAGQTLTGPGGVGGARVWVGSLDCSQLGRRVRSGPQADTRCLLCNRDEVEPCEGRGNHARWPGSGPAAGGHATAVPSKHSVPTAVLHLSGLPSLCFSGAVASALKIASDGQEPARSGQNPVLGEFKGKAPKPSAEPSTPEEFLEAAVAHEEAAEKWRAGDAAKSVRFYQRALEVYDKGLAAMTGPLSRQEGCFDLEYNRARILYTVTQYPLLRTEWSSESLSQQLAVALGAHRRASQIAEQGYLARGRKGEDAAEQAEAAYADVVFNEAQVLCSLVEALQDDEAAAIGQSLSDMANEAVTLFEKCLNIQHTRLVRWTTLIAEAQTSGQSSVEGTRELELAQHEQQDDHEMQQEDGEDASKWASVMETVTIKTVVETWLELLRSLTLYYENLPSLATAQRDPQVDLDQQGQHREMYMLQLVQATPTQVEVPAGWQKEDFSVFVEAVTAMAKFLAAVKGEIRYRSKLVPAEDYAEEVHAAFDMRGWSEVFKAPYEWIGKALDGSAERLCSYGESLRDCASTIHEVESARADGVRWKLLTQALEALTVASKIPGTDKGLLARIHQGRGDAEMERLSAITSTMDAEKTKQTLLRNAGIYYKGSAAIARASIQSSFNATTHPDADVLRSASVREAVAASLSASDGSHLRELAESLGEDAIRQEIQTMVGEELVAAAWLEAVGLHSDGQARPLDQGYGNPELAQDHRLRGVIGYHNAFRDPSLPDPTLDDPPPNYISSGSQTRTRPRRLSLNDAATHESRIPAYDCTVHAEGRLDFKVEKKTPFTTVEDPKWEHIYAILRGTALHIHTVKSSNPLSLAANPALADHRPGKLLRSYTLQHAEAGFASDHRKYELVPKSHLVYLLSTSAQRQLQLAEPSKFDRVYQYVIRLRLENQQLLLRFKTSTERTAWMNKLSAAIDISPPLEARAEPKYITLPRRRRRRPNNPAENVGLDALREQQARIIRDHYPQLGNEIHDEQGEPDTVHDVDDGRHPDGDAGPVDGDRDNDHEEEPHTLPQPQPTPSNNAAHVSGLMNQVNRILDAHSGPAPPRIRLRISQPRTDTPAGEPVERSDFDGDGKWAPYIARDAAQESRIRRRCMPSLLFNSKRASDVIVVQGRRAQIDWDSQSLKTWPELPPNYVQSEDEPSSSTGSPLSPTTSQVRNPTTHTSTPRQSSRNLLLRIRTTPERARPDHSEASAATNATPDDVTSSDGSSHHASRPKTFLSRTANKLRRMTSRQPDAPTQGSKRSSGLSSPTVAEGGTNLDLRKMQGDVTALGSTTSLAVAASDERREGF
ncbi:hypothetical protein FH972_025992 [Carpinus fangiana]|uniref:PH domain-containing protein n=1 Tax=Carpinus fangiana TaxID=176857 RepID=A0A5N6L3M0_9ROSI|nr:hypothetical protein FH972_025992 [Carpinus fangiana]